eukprot:TRINITY_DN8745_c0_g1_i1.p1 TRINITY_DN8745_c0_g1~~TRINITY_DN8745_c0_g1_i1.p1  ORF type:complete len:209 (-),score=8.47 TRINITY_DN8745_c0_g1_i1:111-737(-)
MLQKFAFVILFFQLASLAPPAPYYPSPWSYYGLVQFPTSNTGYIAHGYLYDVNYREDEHGIGYYFRNYFIPKDKLVYHVVMNLTEPISCDGLPYSALTFTSTMFRDATFVKDTTMFGTDCQLFSGEWVGIPYTMCHVPTQNIPISTADPLADEPNGFLLFYNTSYIADDGALVPLTYTAYNFQAGKKASVIVSKDDLIPPEICFSKIS